MANYFWTSHDDYTECGVNQSTADAMQSKFCRKHSLDCCATVAWWQDSALLGRHQAFNSQTVQLGKLCVIVRHSIGRMGVLNARLLEGKAYKLDHVFWWGGTMVE